MLSLLFISCFKHNKRVFSALSLALSEILKDNSCPETLEEGIEIINKLNDAIGGDNKNGGFNLDEVLNPTGELDLATLCKELGVMD